MKETFWYKLKKIVFRFIGDIKWAGIWHPFWFTVNATSFRLKGKQYREAAAVIKPGDILIRRFEGYVDKWLIPGWFNHGGIYVGDNQVVHAVSDGVIKEDLIDFMRTDHVVILRPPSHCAALAVSKAMKAVGSDYDFAFDFKGTLRFSCTELVNVCIGGTIPGKKRFGRFTIVADDIVSYDKLEVVWASKGCKEQWMKLRSTKD